MRFFKTLLYSFVVLFCVSNVFGQNISIAINYVEQGEYKKAKSIYENLYKKNPNKQNYVLGLADVYVQLEEFDKAQQLYLDYLNKPGKFPNIVVELGQIYSIQNDTVSAKGWFDKAIDIVKEKPVFAYTTGRTFQKHNILDYAIQTYEIANSLEPRVNYSIELARLYGETGNEKLMFQNYIKLAQTDEKYLEIVQRNLGEYINNEPENESNLILKRLLLQNLQQNPLLLYNQILSWVFVQEESFNNAFTQEKAIFKRQPVKDFSRLIDLAFVSTENNNYDVSIEIYEYIIQESQNIETRIEAIKYQTQAKLLKNPNSPQIEKDFENHFETYGYTSQTLSLQLLYIEYLAFTKMNMQKANALIEQALSLNSSTFMNAQITMLSADILVAQQQYNKALIKYSLVSKQVKNTPLAQEAKYKTAMTSYYKGDFDWALTQLNVLKKATTQTIANDALEMAMFIKQGKSDIDSTQQALKKMAKADLLAYQSQPENALIELDGLISESNNYHIIDQALYKKALVLQDIGRLSAAEKIFIQLIENYPDSIVIDNALYSLAQLQINKLDKIEEGKQHLEAIIYNHQDSIFFVEARKLYRKLRNSENIQ